MKVREAIEKLEMLMPRDDCFLVISSFLSCDKLDIIKYLDYECTNEGKLEKVIERYKNKEPLPYILNQRDFYGVDLYVDDRVLIPRFETEELLEKVFSIIDRNIKAEKLRVLDIGTGSGAIALAVKRRYPEFEVDALDISKDALDVAKINMERNNLDINLIESDLFQNVDKKYSIIISNPPYLKEGEASESVDLYEPHLALYSDNTVYYYERILKDINKYLEDRFLIAFETNDNSFKKLDKIINKYLKNVEVSYLKDLNNRERFVIIHN